MGWICKISTIYKYQYMSRLYSLYPLSIIIYYGYTQIPRSVTIPHLYGVRHGSGIPCLQIYSLNAITWTFSGREHTGVRTLSLTLSSRSIRCDRGQIRTHFIYILLNILKHVKCVDTLYASIYSILLTSFDTDKFKF